MIRFRVGQGFDSHRFGAGRTLRLCGVAVPSPVGLEGHSDADVALHAVIDALLGAVGAGDIGEHFPATDDRWLGRRLAGPAGPVARGRAEARIRGRQL